MGDQTLRYYNENAQLFVAGTQTVDFTNTQDLFLTYLQSGDTILDFGCGSGRDSKYFLNQQYRVVATDGSEELCRVAAEYTGLPVQCMLFEELNERECFDGIWACSSILHVAKEGLPDVFERMILALKPDGVIYTSFKYGDFEGFRGERYFSDFDEESFRLFIKQFPELSIEILWISNDIRPGRGEERWLNTILRKVTIT